MPESSGLNQDPSTDARVGALLRETRAAAERVELGLARADGPLAAVAAPDPEGPVDIGRLDDDLAKLTQSMIERERISPDDVPAGPEIPATTVFEQVAPPAPTTTRFESVAPPTPAPAVHAAQPPPAAETAHFETNTTPSPASAGPGARSVLATPRDDAGRAPQPGPGAGHRGSGMVRALLAAVSAPLLARPRAVRDTVGWLGVWTLVLAACVWLYALFALRTAPESSRPIEVVSEDRATETTSAEPESSHDEVPAASGVGHEAGH